MVLREAGKPLETERREIPVPKPGEALVRLHYAALNHRDLWMRKGAYGNVAGIPGVPGSDGYGIVEAVGSKNDSERIDSKVVIFPSLDWGDDDTAPGPLWRILGLPDPGSFAEYIVVQVSQLFRAPDNLSPEESASLPLAGLTAHRALFRRGGLKAGEKILITGIGGGVAQFLTQFAVAAGAEIWVTSGSSEKIEAAKKLGAKGGVLYTSASWADELVQTAGHFDLCVDSAAGSGWNGICETLKPGGRLVFFGATRGAGEIPMRKAFFKQISVLGTAMGSARDFQAMLDFVQAKNVRPVIDSIFPLEEAEQALTRMDQGLQTGKIVLRIA
jgi:NADPH:quinone reductase-like Zn-dependent oxidoreductase